MEVSSAILCLVNVFVSRSLTAGNVIRASMARTVCRATTTLDVKRVSVTLVVHRTSRVTKGLGSAHAKAESMGENVMPQ